jgi:L-fucose isomerase-like protein
MTETIYDVETEVLAHQKQGDRHRLVHCCNPPQKIGEWAHKSHVATVGPYKATFNGGPIGGKQVR